MKWNILLAEDDDNMRFMLQDNLELAGYSVCAVGDGQTALSAFMKQEFSICILDVMLPRKDGFALATDLRRLNNQVPIIFLTARSLKEDRIHGFKIGADDYITKPFSIEELLLRIEAIAKRVYKVPSGSDKHARYELGDLIFDFGQQKITLSDKVVSLTSKESKLLRLFCIHRNKVIERDIILKAIWEDEGYFVGRSMDVFISRLRKILKDNNRISIQTIHGVGYKLNIDQVDGVN